MAGQMTKGWMDRQVNNHINKLMTNGWMDGHTGRQTYEQKGDTRMDRQVDKQ